MKLTKRQLNKKLGSKILKPMDGWYTNDIKDIEIRVIRARDEDLSYTNRFGDRKEIIQTCVTIRIKAMVKSNKNTWHNLKGYGPRAIRNYIRKPYTGVNNAVSRWVRLWGFDSEVTLETIELLYPSDKI